MQQITLDMFESAAIGALVLVAGILLVKRFRLFRRYYIPAAVVGGILFSVLMLVIYETVDIEVDFDGTIKDICMNLFFCSIGFMASISMMRSGGRV
ncbi:MAG: sodium:glutamate symporter, partial [Candidatus Methanomethylophilaceae archaeon]|nr:sodium:glutamate symporter [Candidatus Methanomethylophilaceae archaeon]